MFLRIAKNGGEKIEPGPVRVELALEVQYRMPDGHIQVTMYPLVGPGSHDPLLSVLHLDLVSFSENVEQRMILEFPVGEPGQVDVGQKVQVVKNRLVVHQPEPFQVNATGIPECCFQREHKRLRPTDDLWF